MEAVRISSAGWPSRSNYRKFYERYKILKRHEPGPDPRTSCQNLLDAMKFDQTDPALRLFQLGKTKIFLKAGMVRKSAPPGNSFRIVTMFFLFYNHYRQQRQNRCELTNLMPVLPSFRKIGEEKCSIASICNKRRPSFVFKPVRTPSLPLSLFLLIPNLFIFSTQIFVCLWRRSY